MRCRVCSGSSIPWSKVQRGEKKGKRESSMQTYQQRSTCAAASAGEILEPRPGAERQKRGLWQHDPWQDCRRDPAFLNYVVCVCANVVCLCVCERACVCVCVCVCSSIIACMLHSTQRMHKRVCVTCIAESSSSRPMADSPAQSLGMVGFSVGAACSSSRTMSKMCYER